jgi:hypothetical protein
MIVLYIINYLLILNLLLSFLFIISINIVLDVNLLFKLKVNEIYFYHLLMIKSFYFFKYNIFLITKNPIFIFIWLR